MKNLHLIALVMPALITTPALAQDWSRYANGRFGYAIEIPPGYVAQEESANGDGRAFHDLTRHQALQVWGGRINEDLPAEIQGYRQAVIQQGWRISYDVARPEFASLSGVKGQQIFYQRIIPLCDGISFASFRIEYSAASARQMDPVVRRLVRSLKSPSC